MSRYRYREELIMAVSYLINRGITRSGEIAKRLDVSPYTVRNIKSILKRRARQEGRGKDEKPTAGKKMAPTAKAKFKKHKDVIEELLGGV